MKQAEFVTLLRAEAVEQIWIVRDARDGVDGWSVHVSAKGFRIGGDTRYWIEPARADVPRLWASLDTLHAWLMSIGWDGPATITP